MQRYNFDGDGSEVLDGLDVEAEAVAAVFGCDMARCQRLDATLAEAVAAVLVAVSPAIAASANTKCMAIAADIAVNGQGRGWVSTSWAG